MARTHLFPLPRRSHLLPGRHLRPPGEVVDRPNWIVTAYLPLSISR